MTPNRLHQMRIAVGVSGGGRSLANLIEKQSNLSYEVGAVFSSSPNIGASVHFVSARYDKGKIIAQSRVPVGTNETAQSLAAKVFKSECLLLPWVVSKLARTALPKDGIAIFNAQEN